jgi:hypothetical protein
MFRVEEYAEQETIMNQAADLLFDLFFDIHDGGELLL